MPPGMTDMFPALSLGGVALIGLMQRLDPSPALRWSVVAAMGSILALYLAGQLHVCLPDSIGLPLYVGLLLLSSAIIACDRRAARRR